MNWLRLFDNTSFDILLIENTLADVKVFLILFSILLVTYGLLMHMLDINRDEQAFLIEPEFGFWPIDGIYGMEAWLCFG